MVVGAESDEAWRLWVLFVDARPRGAPLLIIVIIVYPHAPELEAKYPFRGRDVVWHARGAGPT